MDIEKKLRGELISHLSPFFECLEEVELLHAVFSSETIRADVVCIPRDPAFAGQAFAFEVKSRTSWDPDIEYWFRAIHQCRDYVWSQIGADPRVSRHAGQRITAAFVFPSPLPFPPISDANFEGAAELRGAFGAAVYSRVGTAGIERKNRFVLRMGHPVWRSDRGFGENAGNILCGKVWVGSGRRVVREMPLAEGSWR